MYNSIHKSQQRGSHFKDSEDRTTRKGQGSTSWPACMQSPSDVLVTSTQYMYMDITVSFLMGLSKLILT